MSSEILGYNPKTGTFWWKRKPNGRVSEYASPGIITNGYLQIQVGGHKRKAHRVAWFLMTGAWPKGHIDHINGDRSDNRWSNLRDASVSENARNRRGADVDSKSGHRGVYWHKQRCKWASAIRHHGKQISLGLYENIEDAISVRAKAEQDLWSPEDRGGRK